MDSGKIIEEHGKKYYINDTVRYELISSQKFDYRGGSEAVSSQSVRVNNLILAAYVRQLGYYESETGIGNGLSDYIRLNKTNGDYGFFLADAMLKNAEKHFPILFDADIIVPIPNYKMEDKASAVSIAKHLSDFLKKPCENMLVKNKDVHIRNKTNAQKKEIFKNHDVYGFNPEFDSIIQGKNIALIDDVVTSGYTARECLRILFDHKDQNCKIYFYCAGTTYYRYHG